MDDPYSSPEFEELARRAIDDLLPNMRDCAATVSLVPKGEGDVKFAIELGFSIMLDKPIIAVITPGQSVPAKLVAVADAIVEGDIGSPDFTERLMTAVRRATQGEQEDGV